MPRRFDALRGGRTHRLGHGLWINAAYHLALVANPHRKRLGFSFRPDEDVPEKIGEECKGRYAIIVKYDLQIAVSGTDILHRTPR
jgi:hypothetical protein